MAEWRLIHDDYYEVSIGGDVRRAKPGTSTFVGRPVMPVEAGNGYLVVQLCGATKRRAYVHHLVAEAFIGVRPDGFVINHRDGVRTNNSLSNLEYVSRAYNAIHAATQIGRRKGPTKPVPEKAGPPRGEKHWTARMPDRIARERAMPHCKLTNEMVRDAKRRVIAGETQRSVAADLGVSIAQISRIITGKRRLSA